MKLVKIDGLKAWRVTWNRRSVVFPADDVSDAFKQACEAFGIR